MLSNRRFSRRGREVKLARRPDMEAAIAKAVEKIIKDHDPTVHMPAVRLAAKLSGIVASHLAAQKQIVQRALQVIEPSIEAIGIRLVDDLVVSATTGVQEAVERFVPSAPAKGDARLNITTDWAGEVAGPTFIERHFGIPRSTLHRWQKRNEVVWLQSRTSKKPVFPLRQFKNGRPVDGIPELIAVFGDPGKAWEWSAPRAAGGPLAKLLEGEVDKVLREAREYLSSPPHASHDHIN